MFLYTVSLNLAHDDYTNDVEDIFPSHCWLIAPAT